MKGNAFIGKLAGKLGDVVAAVQNGQQTYRSYNASPRNPKSTRQQFHRAQFKNVVMFYKHGVQALFKFAFEGKRAVESDFNAFMRLNAKRGVIVTREASNLAEYPSLGHYILTDGSLPMCDYERNGADGLYYLGVAADAAPSTIGALSALMIEAGLVEAGDIVTTLNIKTTLEEGATLPAIFPATGDYKTKWIIRQFIVDVNSADTCESKGIVCERVAGGIIAIKIAGANMDATHYEGVSLIFSRNTANGLKVSTSELQVSAAIETAIAACDEESYKSAVKLSWDASADAILQGSLATESSAPVPPTPPTGKVTLTISSNNTSLGATTPTGAVEVEPGTSVQIKANIIDDEAFFDGWSDGNEEQTRTVIVINDMSLTAQFSK